MNKTVLGIAAVLAMTSNSLAAAEAPENLTLSSRMPNIALVELTSLPPAPEDAGDWEWCGHLAMEPVSRGGHLAQSLGWRVTGEVVIEPYDVVSFVGGFVAGTSGACQRTDGNIGIFHNGDLIALAYGRDPSLLSIGLIEPFEDAGARIWDGDYLSQPIADLLVVGDGDFEITTLASRGAFCDSAATVPNIFGMPIAEARLILGDHGWVPAENPLPKEERDNRSMDLIALGITEVESCSGTGFGYCSFAYEGKAGRLSVTTVGDGEPTLTVSSYGVQCER